MQTPEELLDTESRLCECRFNFFVVPFVVCELLERFLMIRKCSLFFGCDCSRSPGRVSHSESIALPFVVLMSLPAVPFTIRLGSMRRMNSPLALSTAPSVPTSAMAEDMISDLHLALNDLEKYKIIFVFKLHY